MISPKVVFGADSLALTPSKNSEDKMTSALAAGVWQNVVLAVFLLSRIAYFAAGFRFNATPVAEFWQMIDPELMRTDLLRSIWYLHMQPPGYNLAVGVVVKFFPEHYGAVLWI